MFFGQEHGYILIWLKWFDLAFFAAIFVFGASVVAFQG